MLKYENIIGQLSTSQKIRMLCDITCLSEKEYKVLGIPEIRAEYLEERFGSEFPSPYMLANSWNTALAGEVACAAAKDMSADGATLAITPGAKIKISPYRMAISEDVRLSSAFASEYLKAAKKYGMATCIRDFYLTADEVEWMDEYPKSRFIYEYIVKPYYLASSECSYNGALVSPDVQAENYERVNRALSSVAANDPGMGGAAPVCHKANMANTVSLIASGSICLEGVSFALEAALSMYKQMKKSLEAELISEKDIEDEIAKGKAISYDMLDSAVDRIISFAFDAEKKRILAPQEGSERKDIALSAARESIVLLKNEKKILPLNKKMKVCLLGDIVMSGEYGSFADSFCGELESYGYTCIGKERGYDIGEERGDSLYESAIKLAEKADIAFLFMGFDKAHEKRIHKAQKLSVPANQQVLLESLNEKKTKIIAVVSSDHAADFVLDYKLDAVLIAPVNTVSSPCALAEIVSGKYSPSGRLASSLYLHTDIKMKKQRIYKSKYGVKSGPFIGYRYYDTADYIEGYSFGHGLGYSEFAYSKLSVKDGTVSVTIRNIGKMAASETVQIYIGMQNSSIIRPKKELMAFRKITLEAGEKQTVSVPLELPEVFDTQKGNFITEKGVYTVYAASSVSNVKLSCTIEAGDSEIRPDGEKKSDYLQSESNIISDNYKLEADCNIMKESVFNIIAGIAAILIAVVLKTYCVLSNTNAAFFDVISVLLAAAGWIFFIAEAVYRKKDRKEDAENIERANAKAFEGAEELPLMDADKLFVNEFDISIDDEVAVSVAADYSEGLGADELAYIDSELTFDGAVADFITAAKEKGYNFNPADVSKIFSAMASSRIIITNGMTDKTFEELMLLLGNYFESAAYIDRVDDTYLNAESLLFQNDVGGNRTKTHTKLAAEAAYEMPQKVHFAGLANVRLEGILSYFAPIVKHAKNPSARCGFTVHNERNIESTYYIPQNVWFVLNLAEGESLADMPAQLSEIAAVESVSFESCEPCEVYSGIRRFTYYQMEYLCEKLSSKLDVNELTWKKIDRTEVFAYSHAKYTISNKLWLCLEKYIGTYMTCGFKESEAVDAAMASKLIPALIPALNGKLSGDEAGLIETLENIFGEDNVDACKSAIKKSGAEIV
jgi:beta-glucosidase